MTVLTKTAKVAIVCSDAAHPVNPWLYAWAARMRPDADVRIVRHPSDLEGGDLLFLISCHDIVRQPVRDLYRQTFVIHASDLPKGRGWSPMIWEIIGGSNEITVSLLEAAEGVDSGRIWAQQTVFLDGTELFDEINARLFQAETELMNWALSHYEMAEPREQQGDATYWRKRVPADSQIDPAKPLADSFDLLRVADPDRYPAFFDYRGARYSIRIEKMA